MSTATKSKVITLMDQLEQKEVERIINGVDSPLFEARLDEKEYKKLLNETAEKMGIDPKELAQRIEQYKKENQKTNKF